MIDALMFAVQDGIRAAGMGYGVAECGVQDSERPPPVCGAVYVSIHDGEARSTADNQLNELYSFGVTLTMRVTISLDRIGDQLLHRNIARVPLGQRQGFYARCEQLRAFLHMNWRVTVLQNQNPPSANDNLASWSTGTVYGFVEPMRYEGMSASRLVGGEWFAADPESEDVAVVATLRFGRCRRFQPVTSPSGPFT